MAWQLFGKRGKSKTVEGFFREPRIEKGGKASASLVGAKRVGTSFW